MADDATIGGYVGEKRGDHINIPRTEIMAGISTYDSAAQDDLLWLHGYALDVLHGSRSALVEWMRVDWTTITRVWRGKYEADIGRFISRVRQLRRKAELARDAGFVETVTTRKIFTAMDAVRESNCIAVIEGKSRRGKTHAVKEWIHRNNHGRSLYVDCPATGGLRALLEEIADKACIGKGKNNSDLVDIIGRSFDYRHTIVLDEVARLLPVRSHSITAIEFIRRLHDTSGCGIVLVATKAFTGRMRHGALASWFEQLVGRIEISLQIPDTVFRSEVVAICSAFCRPHDPDPDLVTAAMEVANKSGHVGRLCSLLRDAAALAEEHRSPITAAHFVASRAKLANINVWPQD